MKERKKQMKQALDTNTWDNTGTKTPPHEYQGDESRPHYSQQDFHQKKLKGTTEIRKKSPRPDGDVDLGRSLTAERVVGPAAECQRAMSDTVFGVAADRERMMRDSFDGINVATLMRLQQYLESGDNGVHRGNATEKVALADKRDSNVPHQSQWVLNTKKRHHGTSLHRTGQQRARTESPRISRDVRDPTYAGYQGDYPYGETSEAWPYGRDDSDTAKVGRYKSATYLNVDKRRHNAALDGDISQERAKKQFDKQHAAEISYWYSKGDEIAKPDFLARGDKYKSQYALAQHKRRHLAEIHTGEPLHYDAESTAVGSPIAGSPEHRLGQSLSEKGLYTSQKALNFAKRGHVIGMNTYLGQRAASRAASVTSDGSSSCDVGKGISRMMNNHHEHKVHTSHQEFHLKKKNHSTSVHRTPRPKDEEGSVVSDESRSSFGMHALNDSRRASDPHHSRRAFALKKKYHVTGVHVQKDSRMHPEKRRATTLDKYPQVLDSHAHLNNIKRKHVFEYNPSYRQKPRPKSVEGAPVPRSGQWTPQHL
jgi:hypothetical protein